jgi:hypothetical protein
LVTDIHLKLKYTFAYEMIHITKWCVTFNMCKLNFHNVMKCTVTLSNTNPHCVVVFLVCMKHTKTCILIN